MIKKIKSLLPQRAKNVYHLSVALISAFYYGFPSRKMKIIGVTGTDGKTTTTSLIYHILKSAGYKVGMVSTVNAIINDKSYDTGIHVTSPDPDMLQKFLKQMVDEGCTHAVLEVTSHALDQGRVFGVGFDIVALTNITQEHIEYHGSFEKYREAKSKLVARATESVFLNKDDKSFEFLESVGKKSSKVYSYSLKNKSADIFCKSKKVTPRGTSVELVFQNTNFKADTRLIGDYNISNTMAAYGVVKTLGLKDIQIKKGLSSFSLPVGRLEEIKNDKGFKIYIDFAHTPNSLDQVLGTLAKRKGKGRLISIISCTGDRDKAKRPVMAKIATDISDYCIFTADDPRHEKVPEIFNQMKKGVRKDIINFDPNEFDKNGKKFEKKSYFMIEERGEAITFAIDKLARKGDIVAVCGKAHEKAMNYHDIEYPWDEHKAVKMALSGKTLRIKR